MTTTADRRQQLEYHLKTFREIAEARRQEKIDQWLYHIPAMVSATLVLSQLANTYLFGTFAYNFGQLYLLLDEYMLETNGTAMIGLNDTEVYEYEGINGDRIHEIDLYHDQLWTMFVAEVIQLIFPCVNLLMFAWVMQNPKNNLGFKGTTTYLLCPALSLVLSVSQACMIHVTLSEAVYTIRFLLAKLLGVLLIVNRKGRLPLENYFECEFFNDDDIVKPPCAGTIHDQVVSPFTLNLMIGIHVLPVVAFFYTIIRYLTSQKMEHLFLYIESVDAYGRPATPHDAPTDRPKNLKHTLQEMLTEFEIKFHPKKSLNEALKKYSHSVHEQKRSTPHKVAPAWKSLDIQDQPETRV